jgi:uncharacterized protein YigA (DUF484 family)
MGKKEDIQHINEEIAARFRKIEADVSTAETVAVLFEILLAGIEKEFGVPFVWLTLMDHENAVPLIEAVNASDILQSRLSVVSPELFGKILPEGMKPILANKDLTPFYKLMPQSRKYFVRSMAVVPFALNGQVIGAWNNGDADAGRYAADMDTALLSSLAGKISQQLTQLVAGKTGVPVRDENNEQPGGIHG